MTSRVTSATADRVMLREATALILRPPDHLQFGSIPDRSLILPLPPGVAATQVLLVFREARRPVTVAELEDRLGHCGIDPVHCRGIIADLRSSGLLRPLPEQTPVFVTGPTALAGELLHSLMRTGVAAGSVVPGSASFTRIAPESLVVIAGQLFPAPDVTYRLMDQGIPHLPCAVVDGGVVVGPLVRPGRTPCLSCMDGSYLAEDGDWRMVRAQAATGIPPTGSAVTELAAVVTAGVVRDALAAELPLWEATPEGLGTRRFLDPTTLSVEHRVPQFDPGCRACAIT
ncbi:MAG: TOMM precursor leader peptide-binding protein [Mycobacteriaceae bacterium]|uniref:TOMM precursor leader peptide-binding protein n=1 Tax=Corynebacterium sp. TaxID=1720 RepID=UPI003F991EF7